MYLVDVSASLQCAEACHWVGCISVETEQTKWIKFSIHEKCEKYKGMYIPVKKDRVEFCLI